MRTLRGRVVCGTRLGRRLGFATANLKVPHGARPPRGVWCVKVSGTTLGERPAVCNVGVRPTLGGRRLVVEVHIPGFCGDLYGRTLKVGFLCRIRSERRFSSLAALKARIRLDVACLTRVAGSACPRRGARRGPR